MTRRGAVAAALALALALTGCSALTAQSPTPTSATPAPTAAPSQTTAVAIGDSIAIGYGVPADDAWPLRVATRLGWTLTDLAEGGAGFTKEGTNTHEFGDQVSAAIRLRPQIVIIAASFNDATTAAAAPATVDTATLVAIDRISTALPDTTIIGVSAIWGSASPPAGGPVLDDALKKAVLGVGGHWIDIGQPLTGRPDLALSDHIHPTSAGQAIVATAVADAISKARIMPREARG